ncbi:large conductance mechanosensitive channel protein MscL [Propioniciclava flava]
MKGFRDFLMQGNLIELATAVIIGASFSKVVDAFTGIIMGFIGLFGGQPDFSAVTIPYLGINVGVFINAVVAFVIVAAVLYFFIIKPYTAMKEHAAKNKEVEVTAEAPSTDELLTEIRDLLKARN